MLACVGFVKCVGYFRATLLVQCLHTNIYDFLRNFRKLETPEIKIEKCLPKNISKYAKYQRSGSVMKIYGNKIDESADGHN